MAKAKDKKDKPSEEFVENQDNQVKAYKSKRFTVGYINSTQFYQLPKFLFFGDLKTKLSNNAKILYALLKDRHELSISNGWINDENQVYIIFTRDEMREMLGNVSKTTIKKVVEELKDFDLIDEVQQGLTKPNIIYLKYIEQDFVNDLIEQEKVNKDELFEKHLQDGEKLRAYRETMRQGKIAAQDDGNNDSLQGDNDKKSAANTDKISEVQKVDFRKSSNWTSRSPENGPHEVDFLDSNNTDIYNKTDYNIDTDFNNTDDIGTDELLDVPSINPSLDTEDTKTNSTKKRGSNSKNKKSKNDGYDMIEDIEKYENIIKDNIEYDAYITSNPNNKKNLDEIIAVMTQVMASDDDTTYNIRGTKIPATLVKSRFMMVDYDIADYILWSLRENTADVKDIFKYMVSTIYNAPVTADTWIQQKVQYDLKNKF